MRILCLAALLTSPLIRASAYSRLGGNGAHRADERHLLGDVTTASSGFPQAYTAVTPCPGKGDANVNAIHFPAEVDLLDIVEYGLPSPYDGTGSDFCKISFLVHNALELRDVQNLMAGDPRVRSRKDHISTASDLEPDDVATKRLFPSTTVHDNIFQVDEGDRRLQQYATISGFSCYRSLEGMESWMRDMEKKSLQIANLSIQLKDIGDSYEGSNIWALIVTGNGVSAAGRSTTKAPMFVMSGIHAREYAPPELVARWIEHLISGYGIDADITSILDHTEIHIVLEANPDGRRIAETNRAVLQRKSTHDYGSCGDSGGVDLNRNFPFMWGRNDGSSGNPCAETYRGPSAASEPEVKAIVNYVSALFPLAQRKADPEGQVDDAYPESATGVFLDIHSYGDNIIWPWGYQNVETPNDVDLETLANKYKHFNGYAYSGPNNGFLYIANGVSDDWAYSTTGAAAMTFELGNAFYQGCNYFNANVVQKNIPALTYAAKIASAPYSLPKGPDITKIEFSSPSVAADGVLTVQVTTSDSSWSAGNFQTSLQQILDIRAWIDIHPNDSGAGTGRVVGGFSSTSAVTTGSYNIKASQYRTGRHTIYFQATDTNRYKGPVSAAQFDIKAKDPSSFCFSGETTVEVKDKGTMLITDLQVGDQVLSGDGTTYETVYSFGHRHDAVEATFLQFLPSDIEISMDHMLKIDGRYIPASAVNVGDRLETASGDFITVNKITTVVRKGVYAPFTTSGTIIVSDIKASNYIAFQGSDRLVVGGWETCLSYQWLAHLSQGPHRIWVHLFGVDDEAYSDTGMSSWIVAPHWLADQYLELNIVVMVLLLIPTLMFLVVVSAVEAVLSVLH
jgi:hypothetical protein